MVEVAAVAVVVAAVVAGAIPAVVHLVAGRWGAHGLVEGAEPREASLFRGVGPRVVAVGGAAPHRHRRVGRRRRGAASPQQSQCKGRVLAIRPPASPQRNRLLPAIRPPANLQLPAIRPPASPQPRKRRGAASQPNRPIGKTGRVTERKSRRTARITGIMPVKTGKNMGKATTGAIVGGITADLPLTRLGESPPEW